ncbi:MAG: hypothetical protein WAK26_15710 [Terracidiphilus sp.]
MSKPVRTTEEKLRAYVSAAETEHLTTLGCGVARTASRAQRRVERIDDAVGQLGHALVIR